MMLFIIRTGKCVTIETLLLHRVMMSTLQISTYPVTTIFLFMNNLINCSTDNIIKKLSSAILFMFYDYVLLIFSSSNGFYHLYFAGWNGFRNSETVSKNNFWEKHIEFVCLFRLKLNIRRLKTQCMPVIIFIVAVISVLYDIVMFVFISLHCQVQSRGSGVVCKHSSGLDHHWGSCNVA